MGGEPLASNHRSRICRFSMSFRDKLLTPGNVQCTMYNVHLLRSIDSYFILHFTFYLLHSPHSSLPPAQVSFLRLSGKGDRVCGAVPYCRSSALLCHHPGSHIF